MNQSFSLEQLLKQAIERHHAGHLQEAELLYRKILDLEQAHPDANHNLGTLARQIGKDLEALPFLKAAFDAHPGSEQFALSYAMALIATNKVRETLIAVFGTGKLPEAEALARCLVRLQADVGMGWKALGLALHLQGKEALTELNKAAELLPSDPDCRLNLAAAQMRAGKIAEAVLTYQHLISLAPDFAPAYHQVAYALMELKQFSQAAEYLAKAQSLDPASAKLHSNLGICLKELGKHSEALAHYAKAIELDPVDAGTHCNQGVVLLELKQFQLAVNCFERAIQCQPGLAVAHNNLGFALIELGAFELALDAIQEAVRLAPGWIDPYCNLALVRRELRQLAEAEATFREALSIQPNHPYLYGSWLQTRLRANNWENVDQHFGELEKRIDQLGLAVTPFALLSMSSSRKLQAKVASLHRLASEPPLETLPPVSKKRSGNRIRVGYFSADFHEHATAYLMAELFERHDKEQFEIFAYSFGPATGDPMQLRLMGAFDHFIDVLNMPDREVAQLARQHELDIAVDLKGYTLGCRTSIFAWRAAPIQVSYLGYPGTMGVPYMDYLIADPTLIPEAHRCDYSEKIAYLPNSYQVNDRQRQISDMVFTRTGAGLPESGFVFCCFNNNYKILPRTFDGWMRILQAVEGSVLWLFEDNAIAAQNLRKEAEQRGISANRLVFAQRMPLPQHLARQRLADLFLDTLPYNAHTTASDALWVGLPVLTLIGDTFAGRVAASLLNAIGLPELITTSEVEFEALAIELAHSAERLGRLRRKLEANRLTTPLFDAAMFARDLEKLYSAMVERYAAGQAPDHLFVDAQPALLE